MSLDYVPFWTPLHTIVQSDWQDAVDWTSVTTGVHAPNVQAVLPLHVALGTTTLTLYAWSNAPTTPAPQEWGLGVYIDGVWSTSLPPASGGFQTYTVTLDGADHRVDIVAALALFGTATGNWVYAFDANGVNVRTVAAPTRRWVGYGDSIMSSANANPNDEFGYFPRFRAIYPGRVGGEMWGGRRLFDDANGNEGGFANLDALAAALVSLVQLGGATTTREMFINIGFNDYNTSAWTAATFGTNLASLLVKIHALDATIAIKVASLLITGFESTANLNGELPSDFRAATATACSGKAYVTAYDGTTFMSAGGLDSDGIHPVNAGHQAIALGTGAFAGSTSLKAIYGL